MKGQFIKEDLQRSLCRIGCRIMTAIGAGWICSAQIPLLIILAYNQDYHYREDKPGTAEGILGGQQPFSCMDKLVGRIHARRLCMYHRVLFSPYSLSGPRCNVHTKSCCATETE